MYNFLTSKHMLCFYGGVATGVVGMVAAKSKTARKLAVNTVAKSIMLKDSVMEEYNNIKEEAEDIRDEAKEVAKQKNSLTEQA